MAVTTQPILGPLISSSFGAFSMLYRIYHARYSQAGTLSSFLGGMDWHGVPTAGSHRSRSCPSKKQNSDTSHKEGDPGIFPGGKKSYERDGWRLLPPVTGSKIDNTTFKMDDKGTVLTTYITENFDPKKIKPRHCSDAWPVPRCMESMDLRQSISQ